MSEAFASTEYVFDNEAVAGIDSAELLARIDTWLGVRPDIVLCMVGTNDTAGLHGDTANQTPGETQANLSEIVRHCLSAESSGRFSAHPLVVLMQPPPALSRTVFHSQPGAHLFWRAFDAGEGSNHLNAVKNSVTEVARETGVRPVAVWDRTAALGFDGTQTSATIQSAYVIDGIHLTQNEQQNIADWVFADLSQALDSHGVPQ